MKGSEWVIMSLPFTVLIRLNIFTIHCTAYHFSTTFLYFSLSFVVYNINTYKKIKRYLLLVLNQYLIAHICNSIFSIKSLNPNLSIVYILWHGNCSNILSVVKSKLILKRRKKDDLDNYSDFINYVACGFGYS